MTRTKNRTYYVSTAPIVPQLFADSNRLIDLTDAHLQQIKADRFIQYDLGPSGILQVVLQNRSRLAFDINTLSDDAAESLIVACLHNKTVIGYDLYNSYTFSNLRTNRWNATITLDIHSLIRHFHCSAQLVKGLAGFEQLISMTRTTSFDEAVEQVFDWDEASGLSYFPLFESLPCVVAGLFSESIRVMRAERSNCLTIEAYLTADLDRNVAALRSSTKARLLEFDPCYFESVNDEFRIAVENLRDILALR